MKHYKILFYFFSCIIILVYGLIIISNFSQNSQISENNSFQTKLSMDQAISLIGTNYGGSRFDEITTIAVDRVGNIIVGGYSESEDLPIINGIDDTFGGVRDGFIAKFSPAGQILFSTYFGGSGWEEIFAIDTDSQGNIIVVGSTESTDFPILNAFTSVIVGRSDGFIASFSSSGKLQFSTYFGGSDEDWISSIKIDSQSNIIIAGFTRSSNFPMLNSGTSTYGGNGDGFIAILSSSGNLLSSRYFGGTGYDSISCITIDILGNVLIAGATESNDFPMLNAYFNSFKGVRDGFISKFSPTHQLLLSTYIGGGLWESVATVAVDTQNNIVVGGETVSGDFPVLNASFPIPALGQTGFTLTDSFLSSFAPDGQLIFSTFFGGSAADKINSIAIDFQGNIMVGGVSESANLPLLNSYKNDLGGPSDGFIASFSPTGVFLSSSYLGGPNFDEISCLIADSRGYIVIAGETASEVFSSFPNVEINLIGQRDAFIISSFSDSDNDGMSDLWEEIFDLNTAIDDSKEDPDNDGFSNFIEYQLGFFPNTSDAQGDYDNDGMPNLWEYQMGLSLFLDDAYDDLDNDSMYNLWEYQMGLNASHNDANMDKDGDLVSNYAEFLSDTNASNIWSFPFFYPIFPFIITVPFVLLTILIFIILIITIYFIKRYQKRIQAPTIITAFLVWRGKFEDYKIFRKAKIKGASTKIEYQLVLRYNAPSYKTACEVYEGQFTDYKQYIEAKVLGASTIKQFQLIQKFQAPDYETAYSIEMGGFPSYSVYELAKQKGFVTFEDFLQRSNQ